MMEVLIQSEDALHAVLGTIVAPRPPIIARLGNETVDVTEGIFKIQALAIREQSELEVSDELSASLEAWKVALSHEHHFYENNDLFCVGLQGYKAISHTHAEVSKLIRVQATHNFHHLCCQLEWRCLKLYSLARCV